MYKKRFKQWNARKYNEEGEMKAIVRKHAERARVGKASAFKVRDRAKDIQEVFKYWERKGISVDDIIARRGLSTTPEAVECYTPLCSPLKTPEALATPERILFTLQDYILGSFDAGKWTKFGRGSQSSWGVDSLNHFFNCCDLALNYFQKNHSLEAWQALNNAFASINTILRSEDPSTFEYLLSSTGMMFRSRQPGIALAILRHVSAMAEVLLRSSHPFKVVCMWLASLVQTNEAFDHAISSICFQKMADCFEQLGLADEALRYRLGFIWWIESEGNVNRAEDMLQKLLRDCELTLGEHDFSTLMVRDNLVSYLFRQGDFVRVQEEVQCLLSHHPPNDRSYVKIESLHRLALCDYRLGDTQGAVALIREAIDMSLSSSDGYQARVCNMMLSLEKWLSELGEFEAAAQTQETRLRLQDSIRVEDL